MNNSPIKRIRRRIIKQTLILLVALTFLVYGLMNTIREGDWPLWEIIMVVGTSAFGLFCLGLHIRDVWRTRDVWIKIPENIPD